MPPVAYLFLFVTVFMLATCNNTPADTATSQQTVSPETQPDNTRQMLLVTDSSQYDKIFLKKLASYPDPISLSGNLLITGNDTVRFPEDLPLHHPVVFQGTDAKYVYTLTVKRLNMTTLVYDFHVTDHAHKKIFAQAGRAVLHPMFFLGMENDYDRLTQEEYAAVEYWDNATHQCEIAVRIGTGTDNNGKYRAKVTCSCSEHGAFYLDVATCPTLRSV